MLKCATHVLKSAPKVKEVLARMEAAMPEYDLKKFNLDTQKIEPCELGETISISGTLFFAEALRIKLCVFSQKCCSRVGDNFV